MLYIRQKSLNYTIKINILKTCCAGELSAAQHAKFELKKFQYIKVKG